MHRLAVVVSLFLFATTAQADRPKVEPDEKNIVAKKLPGTWKFNPDLSQRLIGKGKHKIKTITFRDDAGVAGQVPAKLKEKLGRLYLSGWMVFNDKVTFPFLLIQLGGNPHVVFFEKRDGDPFGDAESFYVMLPQAREKANDLLFVGGDMPREPFMAFDRVK